MVTPKLRPLDVAYGLCFGVSILCLLFIYIRLTDISKQQPVANQDAVDLVQMVDDLLDDVSTRFAAVSTEIFAKSALFPLR